MARHTPTAMDGSIGDEFVILTAALVLCLGAVLRFARVDPTEGRDVALVVGGTFGYWGTAPGVLETFGGGDETVGPLPAGLLLVTVAAVAFGRFRRG